MAAHFESTHSSRLSQGNTFWPNVLGALLLTTTLRLSLRLSLVLATALSLALALTRRALPHDLVELLRERRAGRTPTLALTLTLTLTLTR